MATIDPITYGTNLPKFLDLIAHAEGTSSSTITHHDGYDIIVSSISGPARFDGFACHPFCIPGAIRPPQVLNHAKPQLLSTAAGRYQLLGRYWPSYQAQLKLPDFGPLSQDKIAMRQIQECHALELVLHGQVEAAIAACRNIWASLPGNGYGQGGKTVAELMTFWGEGGAVNA